MIDLIRAAQLEALRVRAAMAKLVKPGRLSEAAPEVPTRLTESYAVPSNALQEAWPEVQADANSGGYLIRNCTFVRAGLNKHKTRRWDPELLAKNIALFEGALCYVDHPQPQQFRSLRSLAGHTVNTQWDAAKEEVVGDVMLLDNEAGRFTYTVFSNPVIRQSGEAGMSIHFEGGTYDPGYERVGGKSIQVPQALHAKPEIDFVAHPGAGGTVGPIT